MLLLEMACCCSKNCCLWLYFDGGGGSEPEGWVSHGAFGRGSGTEFDVGIGSSSNRGRGGYIGGELGRCDILVFMPTF